jgi:hypothetical protein
MHCLDMHVFFPSFIIEVDTATDCHLHYAAIRQAGSLANLNYVQPKHLVNKLASAMTTESSTRLPARTKPYDDPAILPTFAPHWPKFPPSPQHPHRDMSLLPPSTYTKSLKDLDREGLIQRLYLVEQPGHAPTKDKSRSMAPLDCMDQEEFLHLLHPTMSPPAICPCDATNVSNTKSH